MISDRIYQRVHKKLALELFSRDNVTYNQFYQAVNDCMAYAVGAGNEKLYQWIQHQSDLMRKYQVDHSHAKHVPSKWWSRVVTVVDYEIWKGWD